MIVDTDHYPVRLEEFSLTTEKQDVTLCDVCCTGDRKVAWLNTELKRGQHLERVSETNSICV
jgi:hypothetical protein